MSDTDWTPIELEPGYEEAFPNLPQLEWRMKDGMCELRGAVRAPKGARDGDLVGRLPFALGSRMGPERLRVSFKEDDDGGVVWTGFSIETDGRILYWPTVPDGYEPMLL